MRRYPGPAAATGATLTPVGEAERMPAMRAAANGIEIEYDTFGDPADPTLLLVRGLGAQMVSWHPDLCHAFVDRGFHVVRFDNRDVGLSTKIDDHGVDVMAALLGAFSGPVEAPYLLSDMAADSWGLLDHLGIDRAHLMGESMGGMIVQQMAIDQPERTLSLVSCASTTGDPDVGQPNAEAVAMLLTPSPADRQANIDLGVEQSRFLAGPVYADEDWDRERLTLSFDRCHDPDGTVRQLLAVLVSPVEVCGAQDARCPCARGARRDRPAHRRERRGAHERVPAGLGVPAAGGCGAHAPALLLGADRPARHRTRRTSGALTDRTPRAPLARRHDEKDGHRWDRSRV